MEKEIIKHFNMHEHPEGGYYAETYRSKEVIPQSSLGPLFHKDSDGRPFSTAIYFLLDKGNFSCFHKIASDEQWHWYQGGSLLVHVLHPAGSELRLQTIRLGPRFKDGDVFQFTVPAGCWFASEPAPARENEQDWVLVGCTVAPGFDFRDFEMAKKGDLIPSVLHTKDAETVHRLCRQ
jgi:predicted cupin superfamily sugar epimerase